MTLFKMVLGRIPENLGGGSNSTKFIFEHWPKTLVISAKKLKLGMQIRDVNI